MVFSLLLLCSAQERKEREKDKNKTTLHSFFILIHSSIHSISHQPNTATNPPPPPPSTLHSPTPPPHHAHPTNPPPPPPPPPPPLHNPQPRHPRHLQPNLTHLSNFTNVQRIFPPDLEFAFRYAWIADFGGDFSGDCGVEWNFCGGGSGLWEWEGGRRKGKWKGEGDGMFFSSSSSSFSK